MYEHKITPADMSISNMEEHLEKQTEYKDIKDHIVILKKRNICCGLRKAHYID